jgi:hypothetical protein
MTIMTAPKIAKTRENSGYLTLIATINIPTSTEIAATTHDSKSILKAVSATTIINFA